MRRHEWPPAPVGVGWVSENDWMPLPLGCPRRRHWQRAREKALCAHHRAPRLVREAHGAKAYVRAALRDGHTALAAIRCRWH